MSKLKSCKKSLLPSRAKHIRKLDEYTDNEKIEKFDKLYESALSHLKNVESDGTSGIGDDEHFIFEEVMELLSREDGSKIWDYYNSLCD